jgi:Ser/Thr protein kinase RdoA (MazF antagonist)
MLDELLHRHWNVRGRVARLDGGMNSRTWLVETATGDRLVAKAVPAGRADALSAGLAIAGYLDAAGIRTGAPLPTVDGALVARYRGRVVALLRWVDGEPLSGVAAEQPLLGATLGAVHRVLRDAPLPGGPFDWLDPAAPHLDVEPWVRGAVAGALTAYRQLPPLTTGLLHTDPAPEAFRYDGAVCGLIDWSTATRGPLLYDVASAVMYVGGPEQAGPLLAAYRAAGVLPAGELAHLPVLLRLRWAVQAHYFAWRTVHDDLTGIDGPAGNAKGLADARRKLTGR